MYNIRVKVKLTERGCNLLGTETYECTMKISDQSLAEKLQPSNHNYIGALVALRALFVEQIMPTGMFIIESFEANVIDYTVTAGEWMYAKVQLNPSTAIKIPYEVYFNETDGDGSKTFHLRPIEKYNYCAIDEDLSNSSYTNKYLRTSDRISRRKFSSYDFKEINGSSKMDITVYPMPDADCCDIKDSIKWSNAYDNAVAKIQELVDNPEILAHMSQRQLKSFVEMIDTVTSDAYDDFGQ